ncbi:hypothetical protein EVAR_46617_1 [Eumeta japonica]|uniref:Uncharacterized protein n=1 Tax=Eumeta variegata TaxID=151549 RepID=A0A4C1ZBL3_EUMVA|nr:hypothetical protein EVAR_46617_1 [Eumeta japonica]
MEVTNSHNQIRQVAPCPRERVQLWISDGVISLVTKAGEQIIQTGNGECCAYGDAAPRTTASETEEADDAPPGKVTLALGALALESQPAAPASSAGARGGRRGAAGRD